MASATTTRATRKRAASSTADAPDKAPRTFIYVYPREDICDVILTVECGSIKCHLYRLGEMGRLDKQQMLVEMAVSDETDERVREINLRGKLTLDTMTAEQFRQLMDIVYLEHGAKAAIAELSHSDLIAFSKYSRALDLHGLSSHFQYYIWLRYENIPLDDLFDAGRAYHDEDILTRVLMRIIADQCLMTYIPERMQPALVPLLLRRMRTAVLEHEKKAKLLEHIKDACDDLYRSTVAEAACSEECPANCNGHAGTHPLLDNSALSDGDFPGQVVDTVHAIYALLEASD